MEQCGKLSIDNHCEEEENSGIDEGNVIEEVEEEENGGIDQGNVIEEVEEEETVV